MYLHHISLELTAGVQNSLFQVFNTLVRASPESREAVLQYFARVINLNVKRAGLQVGEDTIATDSFMVNLQTVLYRLAEPFMDANYTKVGRLDSDFTVGLTSILLDRSDRPTLLRLFDEARNERRDEDQGHERGRHSMAVREWQ